MAKKVTIFSDGASSGNPGPGGWGVIVSSENRTQELGGGEPSTTNNRMELMAALEGLRQVTEAEQVVVYTDSKYLIQGITGWVFGWQRNGWQTKDGKPVKNQEIWSELLEEVQRLKSAQIQWQHVPGHSGIPGNERADQIATGFAKGPKPNLFDGATSEYQISLVAEIRSLSPRDKVGYPRYLSLIDGELQTHDTWNDCEARVRGRRAKFKKVKNRLEEDDILKSWGKKS